jgi:hypothetical protein
LLVSLFPYASLIGEAKNPKSIATTPQKPQKSPSIGITVTYKTYVEDRRKHPQIKEEIEKNYKKYLVGSQAKEKNVACNHLVSHRLLCIVMVKRKAPTSVHDFAGNLAVSSSTTFTLIALKNTYVLVHGGPSPSPNATTPNTKKNTRANVVFSAIAHLDAPLSNWFADNMNATKKNTQSQIIVYDIRDCNTDPQCPNYKPKNKSTKKPANLAKKTKS